MRRNRFASERACCNRVMVLIAVLFLLMFSALGTVWAETISLSLEEAIALGLNNSTSIKAKLLAVHAAKADIRAANSAFYPTVSAAASWTHFFDQKETPETTVDLGGMSVTMPGSYLAPSDPITISTDVGQSIYTFGRIKKGIKLAEEGLQLSELDFEEEKRNLIVRIKRAFYGYMLAKKVVKVQEETLAQKEDALEVAKKRFEAGLSPDFEVLSAESDLESFKPGLISARNQVQFALLAVKDLLGIEDEGDYEIDLIGSLEAEFYSFDKKELIGEALKNNYTIRQYQSGINLADYQKSLKEREKRPIIAGFANYTLQSGFDAATGKNEYWGSNSWEGDLTVGISIQMQLSALFPWSRENAESIKSALDLEGLKVARSSVESGIRLNIENILLRLEEEKSKIASMNKGVELASRLYESSRERYAHGLISSTDLKDAQIKLNAAKVGSLTSVFNYKTALFDLMDAVGVYSFE